MKILMIPFSIIILLLFACFDKSPQVRRYLENGVDVFNPEGIFVARLSVDIFRDFYIFIFAKARSGRLYIVQEKDSGYKRLVAYRMMWE